MLKIKCPECGEDIIIDNRTIDAAKTIAEKEGFFTFSIYHGNHIVEIVLDNNASVRGIRAIPLAKGEHVSLLSTIDMKPVPKKKIPSLSKLTRDELMVWVYVNGENTIKEIARFTKLPVSRIKTIVEILKNKGFIEEIIEVVR